MTLKTNELSNFFIRGAVAAALLTALQQTDSAKKKKSKPKAKKVLKRALQGGVATAVGMGVANAVEVKEYEQALLLLLGGGAGIASIELLIKD